MTFPDTNIEMLDAITEGHREWNEKTDRGEKCCGGELTCGGYCSINMLHKCVWFVKAYDLIMGETE